MVSDVGRTSPLALSILAAFLFCCTLTVVHDSDTIKKRPEQLSAVLAFVVFLAFDYALSRKGGQSMGKHLTYQQRIELEFMHKQGYSRSKMAAELGVSVRTVGYGCKRGYYERLDG